MNLLNNEPRSRLGHKSTPLSTGGNTQGLPNDLKPTLCRGDFGIDLSPTDRTEANQVCVLNPSPKIVILRLTRLMERIGLGRSSVYALMDSKSPHYDPSFPRRLKISAHAVGWIEAEVDTWLEARVEARRVSGAAVVAMTSKEQEAAS